MEEEVVMDIKRRDVVTGVARINIYCNCCVLPICTIHNNGHV